MPVRGGKCPHGLFFISLRLFALSFVTLHLLQCFASCSVFFVSCLLHLMPLSTCYIFNIFCLVTTFFCYFPPLTTVKELAGTKLCRTVRWYLERSIFLHLSDWKHRGVKLREHDPRKIHTVNHFELNDPVSTVNTCVYGKVQPSIFYPATRH